MNPLAAWWRPGTRGFDTPAPLEFASLVPPRRPNACLALPDGHSGQAHLRTPPLAAAPAAVFAALLALGDSEPRTTRLAAWPERRQAQWVVRSALLRFPDLVVAEARPAGEGTALFLYSRSLLGWSDLGVNRARLARWLAALPRALPPPPAAPPAPPAPTRFARALLARAPGRHLLITAETPDAAGLLLEALAAGAASARVLGETPPPQPDAALRAAGWRLGLESLADEVLAQAGLGFTPPPPAPLLRSDAPRAWWENVPLDAPDLAARLGTVDLLADGFGLHRRPEPLRQLAALRRSGAARLLIETMALPSDLLGDKAPLPAALLDAATSTRLDAALRARGVTLPQLTAAPEGLSEQASRALGLPDPWWWFLTAESAEDLLAAAGWRVVARRAEELRLLIEAEKA